MPWLHSIALTVRPTCEHTNWIFCQCPPNMTQWHTILHWVSGGPVSTPTEYYVSVCLIWHNGYTILHWVSGRPVSTPTEYCISICLIRHNGYTILHWVSGGPESTPAEYCTVHKGKNRHLCQRWSFAQIEFFFAVLAWNLVERSWFCNKKFSRVIT